MIEDPTPETPFLRSDCDGTCAGLGFDAIVQGHGHSHSHAHNQRNDSRPRGDTALSVSKRRSTRLAGQNDIGSDLARATPTRYSVTVSPDCMNTVDVNKIRRAVDLDDPTRTDYTYSHSDSYVRPGSSMARPQWEIPKLSRIGLRRSERYAHDTADYSDYGSDYSYTEPGSFAKACSWLASCFRPSAYGQKPSSRGYDRPQKSSGGLVSLSHSVVSTAVSIVTSIVCITTIYPAQKLANLTLQPSRRPPRPSQKCCCILLPLLLLLALLLAFAMHRAIYGQEETDRLVSVGKDNFMAAATVSSRAVNDGLTGAGAWLAATWPLFYAARSTKSVPPPPADTSDLRPLYAALADLEARIAKLELGVRSDVVSQRQLKDATALHSADVAQLTERMATLSAALSTLQRGPSDTGMVDTGLVDLELADMRESLAALRSDLSGVSGRIESLAESQMEQQTEMRASFSPEMMEKLAGLVTLGDRVQQLESTLAAGQQPDEHLRAELVTLKAAQRSEMNAMAADLRWISKEMEQSAATVHSVQKTAASLQAAVDLLSSRGDAGVVAGAGGLSSGQIKELIATAIAQYDADKTGRADFALESAGGTVVSTRCSETYNKNTRRETIFGFFPLWTMSYNPRVVIQRRTNSLAPGECWAFKGSKGYLVVQLSGSIRVDSISYEHISADVAPDGHIESAPRRFLLKALEGESDVTGVEIGRFEYDRHGKPLQSFQIQPPITTNFIELEILSNHGHPEYTCLYRLRVHGKRISHNYGGDS